MRIEHVALWVKDLEQMKGFYCVYFGASSSEKYVNVKKRFSSYFLSFGSGARLEIMHRPELLPAESSASYGWAHLAISAGSMELVDELTERLRNDGFTVAGEPRTTGDGYYESVVLDPEGNMVEITA